jgi:hypothetical protein
MIPRVGELRTLLDGHITESLEGRGAGKRPPATLLEVSRLW